MPIPGPATPASPASVAPARPASRRRSLVRIAAAWLLALGMLAFTAWNVTRSNALDRARAAYARGDFRAAVAQALDHLDRRPWSRDAARITALSLSQLNEPDEAEPYFRRAGRLSLDDQRTRALGLLHTGNYAAAAAAYQQIVAQQPGDPVALRRLAAAELGLNKPDEVLELADRLAGQPGSAVVAETLRAVAHHENKDRARAAEAFERIVQLDPTLHDVPLPRQLFWEYFAEDLVALGQGERARNYLERAAADSADPRVMCLLGRAYQFEGAFDQAERWLTRAAQADPAHDLPHLYLGQIARQKGQLDEARRQLETAVRLSPQRYESTYNLALVYMSLHRLDDAERWRERAARLRDGHAPAKERAPLSSPGGL